MLWWQPPPKGITRLSNLQGHEDVEARIATRGSEIDAGKWKTWFGERQAGIEEWNGRGERAFLLVGQLLSRSLGLD